jgi:hypothetical protein
MSIVDWVLLPLLLVFMASMTKVVHAWVSGTGLKSDAEIEAMLIAIFSFFASLLILGIKTIVVLIW